MKLDLYFEGLMQSWRGAERGVTGDAPGKSALVGMICLLYTSPSPRDRG